MSVLTLSVPDELLRELKSRAAVRGIAVEDQAVADLAAAQSPAPGRFRQLAGSLPLGHGDVANRIDEILGDGLIQELRGSSHG